MSEGEGTYTRLSVPALLAAFFGLGAFLVYFSPWFFFLGILAVLLGIVALWAIHNGEGTLVGRPLAYFGVCGGIVALASVTVFWQVYQEGVRKEADQFFRLWFAAVQQGIEGIPQAKNLQAIYAHRSISASAEEWWIKQYEGEHAHRAIHQYVENNLVRTMMALGDKAKVSYYKTLSVDSDRESDMVLSVYAVTFPTESNGTETFFVKIGGKRIFPSGTPDFKAAGWRIEITPEFYLPDEFRK